MALPGCSRFVRPFFTLHSSFCPRLGVAWRGCTWGLQIADAKWPIARPVALFGFSFQVSAFQLLPECGFGRLSRSAASISTLYFLPPAFCFLLLPGVGLSGPFDVGCWLFDVGCSVFTISIPNTTPLSRRPRAGLGAPWYHPGHTLVP